MKPLNKVVMKYNGNGHGNGNGEQEYGEKGSISRSSRFVAKKPHFFRIILTAQHKQMLAMPVKFVNEYRESLANFVYLNVSGSTKYWKVGLAMSEEKVWFESGLQAFLDHHSVMYGHFLVFRYDGDSLFRVIIFDTSATEIEYPIRVSIRPGSSADLEPKSAQMSTVKRDLLDGSLASFRKRKNKSLPCRMEEIPNQMQISKKKRPAGVEDSIALRRAKAFECNGPSFIVRMSKSYVQDWMRLSLPAAHASKYLADQHGKDVFLHQLDGETWPVKCYVFNPTNVRFSAGWKDFVRDKQVQEGDVCVFEMFRQGPNHYKVTLFRKGESSGAN